LTNGFATFKIRVMNNLSESTLLQPNPEVIVGDVDGEVVAVNVDSGNYLNLNSSGSFIFSLLDDTEPKAMDWLFTRVQREYEVDEVTCRQEVSAFLSRCVELDLLRVASAQS
jgi:hypothetical protein